MPPIPGRQRASRSSLSLSLSLALLLFRPFFIVRTLDFFSLSLSLIFRKNFVPSAYRRVHRGRFFICCFDRRKNRRRALSPPPHGDETDVMRGQSAVRAYGGSFDTILSKFDCCFFWGEKLFGEYVYTCACDCMVMYGRERVPQDGAMDGGN